MRVAMLSAESLHSISSGGLGVHVTELAAGLHRRGHELHVITRRQDDQHYYDRIGGVHYHRIDHSLSENFVECMDQMGKAMAHRFHEVTSMIGKFELVHAHDWLAANAMKYVMDGFGTPGIITMHSTEYGRDGNVFFDGFARWVRDIEAAGCHNASLVIAVSHFLAEELRSIYRVPQDKIHVVPNGVDYQAFDGPIDPAKIKGHYGAAPMTAMIFASGRMTVQKGMDLLVEAAPMVLASYPKARFIISGDGPDKEAVMHRAHQIGVADAMVFPGHVPRRHYIALMRACDILVVPSRNEPFGIVILEGWAASKPVVATTSGGPREFVWHGVNGCLVDATPGDIAHGVNSLLADHEHCRRLGANGRRAVEEKFNWDTVATCTEDVYWRVAR
jgi:glycosyltransferase involved in cell wall biosynthesis